VQASGDVSIDVVQGANGGRIAYQDGCNDLTDCAFPRTDTSRVTLAAGCSSVRIVFTDAGASHKWLHVAARRGSAQCSGEPDYPSCNKASDSAANAARSRRRLASTPIHDETATTLLDTLPRDVATGTASLGRALLKAKERSVGATEVDQQSADDGAEVDNNTCEPSDSDGEDDAREDIDSSLDAACSVFAVRRAFTPRFAPRSAVRRMLLVLQDRWKTAPRAMLGRSQYDGIRWESCAAKRVPQT
jgi:hypothetical protein